MTIQPAREFIRSHGKISTDSARRWRPRCRASRLSRNSLHRVRTRKITCLIRHFKGAPYEIGFSLGQTLGRKLEATAAHYIVGTNHFCACEDRTLGDNAESISTLSRFRRMEELVGPMTASPTLPDLPSDLIRILADDQIERRSGRLFTVYSNVACPATGEMWYTFGGYPATSQGNWQRLEWPWTV